MSLFNLMLRQSMAGRGIFLLLAALVLAVTATTSLRFASDNIGIAINQQAGQLLAADMVLSSRQPIAPIWSERAAALQLQHNSAIVFSSMVQYADQFMLVNVKAIEQGFPLRGALSISPHMPSTAQGIPQQGTIWLAPRLFDVLQVQLGDVLRVGDASFRVAAQIVKDSNQETGMSGFSPTVIINQADVAATKAVQVGSRIDYRLLMAGEAQQVQRFYAQYKDKTGEGIKLRAASQGNSRLMKPVRLFEDYAHIASVLTMLLCGVAIALASRRFAAEQLDALAMIRCIGASRAQLARVYLGLLAVVWLLACVMGVALGAVFAYGLLHILHQALPALQLAFQPLLLLGLPALTGVLTAGILLFGFALPQLLQLVQVSPLRVIRRLHSTAHWQTGVMAVLSLLFILAFLVWQTGQLGLSSVLLAALAVLLCVLWWVVRGMLFVLRLTAFGQQFIRQPKPMSVQVLALSLGLGLLSVVVLLRGDLLDRWQQSLPAGTPNQFVYGLPPDQKDALLQQLQAKKWSHTTLYPNVRGRLIAKNDQPFSAEMIRQNNSLRRELNLTQSAVFPSNNQRVAGEPFSASHQVSVEQEVANELGIAVGDHITVSLPSGELKALVVSLRTVSWDSFTPNFFFIFSPNSLDANAGSYLGSFYVEPHQRAELARMIADFPTTMFIDVDAILHEIRRLLTVLGQALSVLAGLVAVAGVLVLLTSLQLLLDERQREVVLLRTLGMSRAQLRYRLGTEMALIGLLAGITALIWAEIVSVLVSQRLDIPYHIHYWWWLLLPLGMMLLALGIGLLRLRPLWQVSPMVILRRDT